MKAIHYKTMQLITEELANLPHEYASKDFASQAEGIAVIREEFMELEQEVFWGKKKALKVCGGIGAERAEKMHKDRMRAEAVQLAAMAIRFIQECTND